MKMIRWWGLVAFVVLLALSLGGFYLLAPGMVVSSLEELGSEALGAKVEVAEADVGLFPLRVTLKQVTAASPGQPMQNLVDAETLSFALDSQALLWKKVQIDELIVGGMKTGTQRQFSGELEGGRKSTQVVAEAINIAVPEMTSEDLKNMVDEADLITLQRVDTLRQTQDRMSKEWQQDIDRDAYQQRYDAIEQELARLTKRAKDNKLNVFKDAKDWKKLKKSIDKERKQIGGLSEKLKSDKALVASQLTAVKNGPQDDVDAILASVGLDKGFEGVLNRYLGPQITPWVQEALAQITDLQAAGDKQPVADPANIGLGQRVFFTDEQRTPDFFIRHLKLSGSDAGTEIDGDGFDLGYLPWITGQPARLDIQVAGNLDAALKASSEWASAKQMQTLLDLDVKRWSVNSLQLLATDQGDWQLGAGDLSGRVQGQLDLEAIDLQLQLAVSNPQLLTPSQLPDWQQGLADAVKQQSQITFQISITGNLQQPSIKVKSNLEKLLQNAVANEAKAKVAGMTGELTSSIQQRVGDIGGLESFSGNFDQWQSELADADQLLANLRKQIKI